MPEIAINWLKLQSLELPVLNQLRDEPGVYRLSYKSSDGSYYVFYVGQTINLKTRLIEHLNGINTNPCVIAFIKNLGCYFVYTIINEESLRNDVERSTYEKFKPKCNNRIPQGNCIDINFN